MADASITPRTEPLYRLDAEQAVLGALIFDNQTLDHLGRLEARHFYDPVHQRIFDAIRAMVAQGRTADGVTLKAFFATDATITEIGGASYQMTLMEAAAPLSAQAYSYAELIIDLAKRRAIAQLGADLARDALVWTVDADEAIVVAERRLADLCDEHEPYARWQPIGEVMAQSVESAQAGDAVGISTGLPALDDITGGLTRGSLWVVAGPPSGGKSLVGQAIALKAAQARDDDGAECGVGAIHLEMGALSVGLRAATSLAHDPADLSIHKTDGNPTYLQARRRKLSDDGWLRLQKAARDAGRIPLRVDTRPHQTLTQIESGARRLKRMFARAGKPLRVLFIDHDGLIVPEKERKGKWEEVSDRWIRLQSLAKTLDVALVVLVQITREGAKQDGSQRPNMGHLANSADIERCADVIILLYREAYFAQRKPDHECTDEELHRRDSTALEMIVDKSRDGQRKTIKAVLDVRTGYLAEQKR